MSFLLTLVWLLAAPALTAQNPPAKPQPASPAKEKSQPPGDKAKPASNSEAPPDPQDELDRAVQDAGADRAALVRNLEDYLRRFPDAPRKTDVYRALVESEMQLNEPERALDYAERLIAIRPDDVSMMMFAVGLLEKAGDDKSLTRAVGYSTRVIDRIEKSGNEAKPARSSKAEWEEQQKRALMVLYLLRGRLERKQKNYSAAAKDFQTSYENQPNPAAALHQGEVAELRGDREAAIRQYVSAFVLPDQDGAEVDRWEVRQKLGNLWRQMHGSEEGLGARLLQAYDETAAGAPKPEAAERNRGLTDPFAFVLRRPEGGSSLKLEEARGKILVISFWATWCGPCQELEPMLERVALDFSGTADVMFLAVNDDEDETRVPHYLEEHKPRVPVAFADGLSRLLSVNSLPTILVFDRSGKIAYRSEGFDPGTFQDELASAIRRALKP